MDTSTTILLYFGVTFASFASIICVASLAVLSPWWRKQRQRRFSGRIRRDSRSSAASASVDLLYRAVEALAITSPRPIPFSARSRDISRRISAVTGGEGYPLPLRSKPEKLYGAMSPNQRLSLSRSSIGSVQSTRASPCHRNSMFDTLSSNRDGYTISTCGGLLAPPMSRPRSGSTSLLHDMAKKDFESSFTTSPVPVYLSTIQQQPESMPLKSSISTDSPCSPQGIHMLAPSTSGQELTPTNSLGYLDLENQQSGNDQSQIVTPEPTRKRSVRRFRRTTLCTIAASSLLKPTASELGASLSELANIMGTQISKSTHTSPSRRKCPTSYSQPTLRPLPPSTYSLADAPGGVIAYRIFIDATAKKSLTLRVHLFSAVNLPVDRPWKNSHYFVRAKLNWGKSQYVQNSGCAPGVCGSPQFTEAHPSILDFVFELGPITPFSGTESRGRLQLTVYEVAGRRISDRSISLCSKIYEFSHATLDGKSTHSTDLRWEMCEPTKPVYGMSADVLTSVNYLEADSNLRFEIHEIRNLFVRLLSSGGTGTESESNKNIHYSPVKLRLRACLVSNEKALRIRKGFNIRLPPNTNEGNTVEQMKSNGDPIVSVTNPIILKDLVPNANERTLTFNIPFQRPIRSKISEEAFARASVMMPNWRIMVFFVLSLEIPGLPEGRHPKAIGQCCLGASTSLNEDDSSLLNSENLFANIAISSSQSQVSQWIHVE